MITDKMKRIAEKLDISFKDIITNETIKDSFSYWEVQNERSENAYLIYECDGKTIFNIDEYKDIKNKIECDSEKAEKTSYFYPVFVFKNLDEETRQYDLEYNRNKTAQARRELKDLFDEKISVYTQKDCVAFHVEDDGVNYLEYANDKIKGYIYNVSYWELKKLFVVQGKRAFRKNSRTSISKSDATKKKVERSFRDYIVNGLIDGIKLIHSLNESEKEILIKALAEADIEKTEVNSPENFWFNHNGVTIFIDKSSRKQVLCRKNSDIVFDSNCAHIINGAQTMTNMYLQLHDVQKKVEKVFDDNNLDRTIIEEVLEKVCHSINIKTILLEGEECFVNEITEGLNTQIPITDIDLIASKDKVREINEELEKEHIRIIRAGEHQSKDCITILEFAKMYRMIDKRPGTSKNLNKNTVEKIVEEALKDPNLGKKLRIVIEANDWWLNKRQPMEADQVRDAIIKYGRNYYCSYVISKNLDYYDDQTFENIFFEFISSFDSIDNGTLDADMFKKDDLFNKIMLVNKNKVEENKENAPIENKFVITPDEKEELIKYLNADEQSKQNVGVRLSCYFREYRKMQGIDFRTITRKKTADDKFVVKETYPFSSKTFTEFYANPDKIDEISFDNSLLKQELEKETILLVIDKNDTKVENIEVLNDISFRDYETEAKEVFEKTKKAFKEGDESLFPKSSDDCGFHIRPKAATSDDTFEFSNGKEITKRTFYANINTLEDLIAKKQGKIA